MDGRAGRSIWIYRHDRNLWSGALPRDCGGSSGRSMPIGSCAAGRCACLVGRVACNCCALVGCEAYAIRRCCCRVAPIRILPVRRVLRHPVFRMPRYSIVEA